MQSCYVRPVCPHLASLTNHLWPETTRESSKRQQCDPVSQEVYRGLSSRGAWTLVQLHLWSSAHPFLEAVLLRSWWVVARMRPIAACLVIPRSSLQLLRYRTTRAFSAFWGMPLLPFTAVQTSFSRQKTLSLVKGRVFFARTAHLFNFPPARQAGDWWEITLEWQVLWRVPRD